MKHTNFKKFAVTICFSMLGLLMFMTSCGPAIKATNLAESIEAASVRTMAPDERYITATADFSIELFKRSLTPDENSLVSPLSVLYALTMTANGASGETLSEMETVLGGGMPIADLSGYLSASLNDLPKEKSLTFNVANSIWFRDSDRLNVEEQFLRENAGYFDAEIYKAPFDDSTLKDVNHWVDAKTDGMIDSILNSIADEDMLYLINAIAFDAEWANIYKKNEVHNRTFTNVAGEKREVPFMYSKEYDYLADEYATGFIKNYAGGRYAFAAILPNEDVTLEEYIVSMSGESFLNLLSDVSPEAVDCRLPKFLYEYELEMENILNDMGMPRAFDIEKADFEKMASYPENIYIGDVIHKTFIDVDERGTKAGAVTAVVADAGGAAPNQPKKVILDRPFLYAIIDNDTNLPVFIGTTTDIR